MELQSSLPPIDMPIDITFISMGNLGVADSGGQTNNASPIGPHSPVLQKAPAETVDSETVDSVTVDSVTVGSATVGCATVGISTFTGRTFEEFFAERYVPMLRLAVALLGSRSIAEDVVQDAFSKCLACFDKLENPDAYVRRAIVNMTRGVFRKRHIAAAKAPLLRPSAQYSEHDDLLDVLDKLPHRQRSALILRYYHQCTEAEIAAALGCRNGTVKSLLSRGIAALREVLDHE
jgi:RNA polymerase sigma-70 factor (sigma-E family)